MSVPGPKAAFVRVPFQVSKVPKCRHSEPKHNRDPSDAESFWHNLRVGKSIASTTAAASIAADWAQRINTKVMAGKAMMSDTRRNSAIKKGTTPLNVSSSETSPAMFWMT
jgi:hypothetical protein